jgi:hypothetical protein
MFRQSVLASKEANAQLNKIKNGEARNKFVPFFMANGYAILPRQILNQARHESGQRFAIRRIKKKADSPEFPEIFKNLPKILSQKPIFSSSKYIKNNFLPKIIGSL